MANIEKNSNFKYNQVILKKFRVSCKTLEKASPLGFHVFGHVLSQLSSFIFTGKSQSRGLVVVSFFRSPLFYLELLKNKGIDVVSSDKRTQILDCYSDPLSWKSQLIETGNFTALSCEASISSTIVLKDVKHMDKLYNSIIELGKGLVGGGKIRFSVAIDSVDEMLRNASMSSVAGLLSNIRSHDQISSIFWLLHSDLHEARVTVVLEYLSSMVASLEPLHQPSEEVHVEQLGINFTSLSSLGAITQGLVPKVQFSLQLSEKERIDRLMLYFLLSTKQWNLSLFYLDRLLLALCDDDEMPDSDEDPDDDLDI
ncbi:hypothetical protein REPUB_Repub12eG0033700 [Reevesia pubescens]